jgi:hypothetical protein
MIKSIFTAAFCKTFPTSTGRRLLANRSILKSFFLSAGIALAGIAFTSVAQAQPTELETVEMPINGDAVTFKTNCEQGEVYLLKSTGTIVLGTDIFDAEYISEGGDTGKDMADTTDVGVDIGVKSQRQLKGVVPGRIKWFGPYRQDHVYYTLVTGNGQPLTLKFVAGDDRIGAGDISVSLYRLTPLPEDFPKPLETLKVSVLDETTPSTMTTSNGTVYLLQCSGSGKVGGGGLGQGDADYMDYKADGSGKVDVGDHDVDYGLGVDETDINKTPRQNWWGPWREDHTYFMLFAGTGQPIHFHYYDVGYGDNSKTDRLTVNVYPVP